MRTITETIGTDGTVQRTYFIDGEEVAEEAFVAHATPPDTARIVALEDAVDTLILDALMGGL